MCIHIHPHTYLPCLETEKGLSYQESRLSNVISKQPTYSLLHVRFCITSTWYISVEENKLFEQYMHVIMN